MLLLCLVSSVESLLGATGSRFSAGTTGNADQFILQISSSIPSIHIVLMMLMTLSSVTHASPTYSRQQIRTQSLYSTSGRFNHQAGEPWSGSVTCCQQSAIAEEQ
uniref:Putative secreted protein n=1 Tax=Anopheles darlingi TaxID=43151 RepID=A0A2M4DGG0_ANODA